MSVRPVPLLTLSLLAMSTLAAGPSPYQLGPDSQPHPGVPHGRLVRGTVVGPAYPDVVHAYAAYVPAQYDAARPACVMVFQDGAAYADEAGEWRVPVVLDNLIAAGQVPVMVAVFVDPAALPPAAAGTRAATTRSVRSFEYDAPTGRYATFVLDELLPAVARDQHLVLSDHGNDRAIAGLSSGGACAFTVAWKRPDAFARVATAVGSFTDLRGGNAYPDLVRKADRRPLRVALQSGADDMDNFAGTWSVANHDMAEAFRLAGYDYRFDFGTEGHNGKHGGSIFPDVLRWLWRDHPKPVGFAGPSHQPVAEIVDDGEPWIPVAAVPGPIACGSDGTLFVATAGRIDRLDPATGEAVHLADAVGRIRALSPGRDGRLWALVDAGPGGRQLVEVNAAPGGPADGPAGPGWTDLLVTSADLRIVAGDHGLDLWPVKGPPAHAGPPGTSLALAPDHGLLAVGRGADPTILAARVGPGGGPGEAFPFYVRQPAYGQAEVACPIVFDQESRLYAGSRLGVQVFDQAGRVYAVLRPPVGVADPVTALAFGGDGRRTLFARFGDRLFRRHTRATGSLACDGPIPAAPPKL